MEGSCREGAREGLLNVIDALKADLDRAAETTGTDHAPIAARADYLRARDAYRRAVSSGPLSTSSTESVAAAFSSNGSFDTSLTFSTRARFCRALP